ncbi:hypothetical protein [Streptomyces gobiensis]|uniref:hypothetical protein n=1 Tax=Streptomyces gobiensis TaxID=2875706 RepID=UPI001E2AC51D|nr:hypothetical protein [Streptomyces gobiensis]UGY92060.1 hypothetical protein test1122_10215 [Streptomyces gobiensis]
MRKSVCALAVAVGLVVTGPVGVAVAEGPESFTIEDSRIVESSGLAASSTHKGIYWTHNDSGYAPNVYAVDSKTGKTVATISLSGIEGRDLEAISMGPDGDIYVGDIGDNLGGNWPEVWIYRFAEPKELRDQTIQPTRYTVRYADGPRDAESLAVHPTTGRVYIVGKNEDGDGLYAGPEELSSSGVNTFQRVAGIDLWATDAAFSPDGSRLAVRGYFGGIMYAWKDGKPKRIGRLSVPIQRQGESMTFTPDGRTLMYGSEGERSEVRPVELSGEQLPVSVAEPEEKETEGEKGAGGPGKSGGSGGDAPGSGQESNLVLGGVVFAVAAGAWMGLRRLFRRRD